MDHCIRGHRREGIDGVANPAANISNAPVEMVENQAPIRVERYELVPDSGGPGQWRGGMSVLKFRVGRRLRSGALVAEAAMDLLEVPELAICPWALREGAELLARMIGPMMPHLAEACWERLGYNTLLAEQPWPDAEPALLVDDTITIAVQVNGKRRDELTVARTASKDEIEALALKLDAVIKAMEGKPAKKVIVVPGRLVNVVV